MYAFLGRLLSALCCAAWHWSWTSQRWSACSSCASRAQPAGRADLTAADDSLTPSALVAAGRVAKEEEWDAARRLWAVATAGEAVGGGIRGGGVLRRQCRLPPRRLQVRTAPPAAAGGGGERRLGGGYRAG